MPKKNEGKSVTTGLSLEQALAQLIEGKSSPEIIPSPEAFRALYSMGFGFYEGGQYEKAYHFFGFLTTLGPKEAKYLMGLGAAFQMQKKYALAVQSYGFAALLSPSDPLPHFHAAECLYRLNHQKEYTDALKAAEQIASRNNSKHARLLTKIALMLNNNS